MLKLPLVSVIVPSYNHGQYIYDTIESIVNQTYKNVELIVIDDGSIDDSLKILESLSNKYNFTFIHRNNKGLSATLNEGLHLSRGEYICVCASDDKYPLDKIEKQIDFIEKNQNYAMVFGNYIIFNNNGDEKKMINKYSKSGWIFNDLIVNRFHIHITSALIRKKVFESVGGFDETLYVEDWDMCIRIANKFPIGYMNQYLAYYRKHDTNMGSHGWKMYEAKVASLKKWKSLDNYDEIMKIWHLKWFRALSRDYKKEAKKYLSEAFKNLLNKHSIIGLVKYYFMKER